MIDYQAFCQIRHLRDEAHLTITQIARQLGLHWQTVSKWEKRPRFLRRQAGPSPRRASKLDPFKPAIQRFLATHDYSAKQLLSRLQEQGYTGRYSILKTYVRQVRPPRAEAFLTLHFAPGQCAQVDWGSWGSIRVGNTQRRLSFFAFVLCHSRQLYVEFTLGQSQEQWLACHEHAFEYLGGVPAEIMVDNCKTDHVQTLLHERSEARHQRLFLTFLGLSAHAQAYHDQLAERRLNLRHHVQKIVALAEIYGAAAIARVLDDAHALGAYSCEYIANLLEQRQRLVPEPGALHLTRASDLLELELPPPDLSPYRSSP